MPTTETPTTKAIEWAVERFSTATQSGWWIERLTQLTQLSSSPAYKSIATGVLPSSSNGSGAVEDARREAARASAAADAMSSRVARLEAELADLKRQHAELAAHLEEAVGPSSEGAHKNHWWSRRH